MRLSSLSNPAQSINRLGGVSFAAKFAAALTLALSFVGQASAVAIPGAEVILSKSVIIGDTGATTYGSYTYDATNNVYYAVIYGTGQGVRKIYQDDSGNWVGETLVYSSDLTRYIRSTDEAAGVTSANNSGTTTPSAILLNPTDITITVAAPSNVTSSGSNYTYNAADNTITITYAAGTLAYIIDPTGAVKINGSATSYSDTKKIYTYDLRAIGSATTSQLDYANAQNGAGTVTGSYGTADWNDVFHTVVTEDVVRDAVTATGTTASTLNIGRQFAWSTDGQYIYASDSNNGLYKISAVTGTTTVIGSASYSEPTVVASSVRSFGSGAGDQVVFVAKNSGELSYVVDNGTSVSSSYTLIGSATFAAYSDGATIGNTASLTSDSQGNIYFYDPTTYSLQKYDSQGRLSTVLTKAEIYEISETNDGSRADSGGLLRLQVQETSSGTVVTWRGDNSYVGGVTIYQTGDFNQDGVVNQTDRTFFITQLNKTYHNEVPTSDSASSYVDYVAADLNGDSYKYLTVTNNVASVAGSSVTSATVSTKDLTVLEQFTIALVNGDFNWNGTVLDAADIATFWSNYGVSASTKGYAAYSVFDGDVTGDGAVTSADYYALEDLAADFNTDGTVDASDLTILQTYWGQTVTDGYVSGDANGDGVVNASDLTLLQEEWGTSSSFAFVGATLTAVPEPAAMLLFGAAFGLVALRRRRNKNA